MKKLLLLLPLFVLVGCQANTVPSARIEDSPCKFNFFPDEIQKLPKEYHGITPTHAVRAQIYTCASGQWHPVGGEAVASIEAVTIDPRVVGEVVKAGANHPWPYNNIRAGLGFEFPIAVETGIQVGISAHFSSVIDAGQLLSCWLVTPDGRTVPGSRYNTVQTVTGQRTAVDCGAFIGETA